MLKKFLRIEFNFETREVSLFHCHLIADRFRFQLKKMKNTGLRSYQLKAEGRRDEEKLHLKNSEGRAIVIVALHLVLFSR